LNVNWTRLALVNVVLSPAAETVVVFQMDKDTTVIGLIGKPACENFYSLEETGSKTKRNILN